MGALAGLLLLLLVAPAGSQPRLVVQRGGYGSWDDSTALGFSPDQRLLAVRYAGSLGVWRLADRALLFSLPLDRPMGDWGPRYRVEHQPLAFSPDGSRLALVRPDRVELLDPATGAVRCVVHDDTWRSPGQVVFDPTVFSPDGRWLAGTVHQRVERRTDLWLGSINEVGAWWLAEVATGRIVKLSAYGDYVDALAWRGTSLTIARRGGVECWDAQRDEPSDDRVPLPTGTALTERPLTSPDGRFAFKAERFGDTVYPYVDGVEYESPPSVQALAFAPDSRRVASLCSDGTVTIHALPSLRPLLVLPGHGGAQPYLAGDGSALAVAVGSSTLALWRRGQGAEPRVLACEAGRPLGFTPDSRGMVLEEREPPKAVADPRPPRSRRLDLASGAVTDYRVPPDSLPLYPWLRVALDRVACQADYHCKLTWTSGGRPRSLDLPVTGDDRWARVLTTTPDHGRALVSAGRNYDHTTGRLFLVDLRAGRILWDQAPRVDVLDAAYTADGQRLVAIGGISDAEEFSWRDLLLFSAADGRLLDAAPLPSQAGEWYCDWGDVYYLARQARQSPQHFGEIAQRILAQVPLAPALLGPPPSVSVPRDADGDIQVRDTATGALRGTLIVSASYPPRRVQWLVHTPDGRWDASPEAERWVRFRVGDELRGPEAGAGQRAPGLLAALLWGQGL